MATEWSVAESYLRGIAERDGITEEHLEHARRGGFEHVSKLQDDDLEAWASFRRGEELSERQQRKLEAIVLPNGLRPAFDVKNDSFQDLPAPWEPVAAHRPFVEACIRGTGRINVPGHPVVNYAGTGFVVGDNLLLTNRHVAQLFVDIGATELVFTPGIVPSVDLKQEIGSDASVVLAITAPVVALSDWDAALLATSALPQHVRPLPLQAHAAATPTGRLATIIGYPALDQRGSTEEILRQIRLFGAVFDKKRLQPGRLMGFRAAMCLGKSVDALAHDCSTLGGNSGSALLDIEAETVVGLHFGGEYLVANHAVPTAALAQDRRFADHGVIFS